MATFFDVSSLPAVFFLLFSFFLVISLYKLLIIEAGDFSLPQTSCLRAAMIVFQVG